MKILDRYIAWTIISSTVTVLIVLVGIFSFFAFIDQLEDVGRGDYGLAKVVVFVLFSVANLTYEMFPMAALIGSLIGFGTMMRNGEVAVIRCNGVPKSRIVFSVVKAGMVLLIAAMIIGEFIAPPAERFAHDYRTIAINNRITFKSENGFWARDGNSYINIREILPGDQLRDVYIYEFDNSNKLRLSTYAEFARYTGRDWVLQNISQTSLDDDGLRKRTLPQAAWDSILKPDLLQMVTINPDSLSIWNLLKYSRYLNTNGQNAQRYEHVLWLKLTYPLATVVMVVLAVPMVMRANRSVTVGQRVLVGALIGLGFHLLNQATGHLGVVYEVPPILSATGPALLMSFAAFYLLAKTP
ncbi:MAG: LPS export ABC transporter permease LptG [Gammaproteobacteria bacterium]|nr:LPS export ABC transporter permease LptG [Gammaproteobacteria bacterium]